MFLGVIKSIGVLLLRVAITLAAITFTVPQLVFAKEEIPDYFATHSKLSEQSVRNLLSQQRCYANEDAFYGCIQGINTIFFNADNPLALTNGTTRSLPQMKEVVKEIEGLTLQRLDKTFRPDPKKTNYELIKERDLLAKQSQNVWKKIFARTQNDQISIERLLDEAFAQKISEYKGQVLAIAINSYLNSAVDPHTNIHSQKVMEETVNTKEESYSGVGIQAAFNREQQILLYPREGSPAVAAGVRKMDVLTHIEGKPAPKNLEEVDAYTDLLRGKENTKVNITVLRKGQSINLTITRGQISTKNLDGKIITASKTNQKLGYIRLYSFMQADLCKDFVALAKNLYSQGAESLILDLRGNGGGDLREVLCMASAFIGANQKLLQFRNPSTNTLSGQVMNNPVELRSKNAFTAQPEELYNLFNRKPLVVLQDSGSASASELLPGALQAYGRVVTVGEKSFGKGTMQQVGVNPAFVGLEEIEGVLLAMTVARFHFADGSTNQLKGILPDFEVYSNPNPTEEDKYAKREADLYTNAIPAGIKRPKGISEEVKGFISSCVATSNDIAGEFAREEESALGADYQLINAKAVASCLPTEKPNLMLANF